MKYLGPPQSGSVANQTFSRNTYGQYARARSGRGGTPIYSLAPAIAAWQALSVAQQRGWQAWSDQVSMRSSLGVQRPLAGVQRFVSAWMLLTTSGGSAPTDAPSAAQSAGLVDATVTVTLSQLATLGVTVVGDGGYWEIQWAVPWSSMGTNFAPGRGATWQSFFPGFVSAGAASSARLFLLPPTLRRAWARTRLVCLDGLATPWLSAGPGVIG